MNNLLMRSAALVLPLMLATAAGAQTMKPPATPGPATAPSGMAMAQPPAGTTKTDLSKTDSEFVTKAAEGGLAEVQMAQLAQQKSQKQGVKDFAQHMIDDHTPNNQKLMTIASSKGITAPTEPSPAQQKMLAKLQGLDGAKFDHAYLTGQVKAHQAMLKVFQHEATNGRDTDLKSFAETTVPTVQQHVTMAQNIK